MRKVYHRRPEDFKRRIIQTNISRDQLLAEEYKWLQLIPPDQIGSKYYNINLHHFGHWTTHSDTLPIREKISQSLITKYANQPELREHLSKINTGKKVSQETRQKLSQSLLGHVVTQDTRNKISQTEKGKVVSPETRAKISQANSGVKRSDEFKQNVSKFHKGKKLTEKHKRKIGLANSKKIKSL